MPRAPSEPSLADVLLQREALVVLQGEGRAPDDFAGLYVGDDDVRRALAALPGLATSAEALGRARRVSAGAVAAARDRFHSRLRGGSRLAILVRSADLSMEQAEVLDLLAAVESSPARQRLVAYVQDDVQAPRVTVAGLARLFGDDPGHEADLAVGPASPLRRAFLVDLLGDGPLAGRACAVPDRVLWHLRGDDHPDPGTPPDARLRDPAAETARSAGEPDLLLVSGSDPETRRLLVEPWAAGALLVSPPPDDAAGWAALVREATVRAVPVLLEVEALDARAREVLASTTHLRWALSSARELPVESVPARRWREVQAADASADAGDWHRVLGRPPDAAHRLTREQLRLVGEVARAGPDPDAPIGPAVRRLAGGHLDGLAVRVKPRRGWDDLVVGTEQEAQLRNLVDRHRRRNQVHGDWGFPALPSAGVVAMFSGPSGTGKTLAAEVVAQHLGLDLYKIDLSAVVSKYIGETEKNLERIFTAAAAVDLVLFFDEADALFGKRSEVGDAHDRYANIEVSYLLQRLESYDGLVVLATNLQGNLDPAFLRRISVAVDFDAPDVEQRRGIWACSFPATAPLGDLDVDFLAERFKVTGGIIHAAVLGAAFLAARDDEPITTEHVVRAMRREFAKLGRLCTEAEFGPYLALVTGGP